MVDGGSTDGSREILERHAHQLHWWCSEKDNGQYHAINKGFEKTSGEIMGWLNSSDLYLPWTLPTVQEIFLKFPHIQWITSLRKLCIKENGAIEGVQKMPGFAGRCFYAGIHGGPKNSNFIQQETVFWRRSLWDQIGSQIPHRFRFAADFNLWGEFFQKDSVYGVDAALAAFRFHKDSRSAMDNYKMEVNELLQEWKKNGYGKRVRLGFSVISQTWKDGKSNWKINKFSGNELIWAVNHFRINYELLDEKFDYKIFLWLTHFILKEFYFIVKLSYKISRLFLWPK